MAGFYAIDRQKDELTGRDVFAVWKRLPVEPYRVLLGEYDSLASAKASVHIRWHHGSPGGLEAWGVPPVRSAKTGDGQPPKAPAASHRSRI